MRLNHPSLKHLTRALVCACLLVAQAAWAQSVILHLRNGDRIAGVILSENTNQVAISNSWIKELAVPAAQIERREILSNATEVVTIISATNAAAKSLVLVKVTPPKPAQTNWRNRIKGDVTLGSDMVYGSTERQIYYGHINLTYAQPYKSDPKEFFRTSISYNAEYGKTDGALSANHMEGSDKTDFDVGKKIYLYNLGRAGYDEIRKINLDYEEGPGAGYHLITRTNFVLNVELGADYQVQERSDNSTTRDFYYRLAEDYTWKINHHMSMTEKFEFFPRAQNPDQFRARFESTLSYALMLNLSVNLTAVDFYDTQPASGVTRNEFQLRTSLGLKF